MEYWEARIELSNGVILEKQYPYTAGGNYDAECAEQQRIEEEILGQFDGPPDTCKWYSVNYINDGEEG